MTHRPIIDAGPSLNFLSIHKERLLISVLGHLSAPETVQLEVLKKCQQDPRFHAAEAVWRRLTPFWMQILPDDATPELAAVVARLSGLPMADRVLRTADLGETMVIAHAVVAAEAGDTVTILIDDGGGARDATSERRRLQRLRSAGKAVGDLRLVDTDRSAACRRWAVPGRPVGNARDLRAAALLGRRSAPYREHQPART